jgi:enterochelin esterase-like enzyme
MNRYSGSSQSSRSRHSRRILMATVGGAAFAVAAAIIFLFATSRSIAQQQRAPIVSPEVGPDNRVTFRIFGPDLPDVAVNLDDAVAEPIPMKKDEHGLWSVTTDPLEPDYYSYTFSVHGVPIPDPANTNVTPNLLFMEDSFHVPGPASLPWEAGDNPHGVVHRHFYHSQIIGDDRDFYVYTPPDYDAHAKKSYPILFLLHGYSDGANGWTAVGRANFVLDNLIKSGKAKPMVIVMPLGYGNSEILKFRFRAFEHPEVVKDSFDKYRDALFNEVIPMVESSYHVSKERQDHAIAGLSMGGAETLYVGLNALDRFAYFGAFSMGGLAEDYAKDFPSLSASDAAKIKVLWISCGKDDHLLPTDEKVRDFIQSKGIKVEWVETPGHHQWQVWRRNLINFAPQLFQ